MARASPEIRKLQGDGSPGEAEARREFRLFLLLTALFSAPVYGAYILAVNLLPEMPAGNFQFIAVFTWTPGAAALATRLIVRRSLRGLGWGWGTTHLYLAGVIVLPFLLAFCVYLPIWASGLGTFRQNSLADAVSWLRWNGIGGLAGLLAPLLAASLGEELGWRGLLTPQLSKITSLTKTSVITGLVWSVWHFPVIALGLVYYRSGVPTWYSLLCFTITVVCLSFFFSWLRLRSASLWPAVVLHASCNAAQYVLAALTKETPLTEYFTLQYGAGFAIASCLLLGLFWKRLQAMGLTLRDTCLPAAAPSSALAERSNPPAEHSTTPAEPSFSPAESSAEEDERSAAEVERSAEEDEHSAAEVERSAEEDERSAAQVERSAERDERSAAQVEHSAEED